MAEDKFNFVLNLYTCLVYYKISLTFVTPSIQSNFLICLLINNNKKIKNNKKNFGDPIQNKNVMYRFLLLPTIFCIFFLYFLHARTHSTIFFGVLLQNFMDTVINNAGSATATVAVVS